MLEIHNQFCRFLVCLFQFTEIQQVLFHLYPGAKPFICNVCGKAFRTSGHLKNHETSHFKDPERPRRITGPRLNKADALPTLPDIELPVCMNKSVISDCLSLLLFCKMLSTSPMTNLKGELQDFLPLLFFHHPTRSCNIEYLRLFLFLHHSVK